MMQRPSVEKKRRKNGDSRELAYLKRHTDLRSIWGEGKIRCPWHEDHNPSLHIYPDHAFCFACQTWADGFDLFMALNEMSFAEAVAEMRKHVGKRVFSKTKEVDQEPVPEEVIETWHAQLLASSEARHWLKQRGIREETMKALRLGWTEGRAYSIPHFVNGRVENIKFRVHPDYLFDNEPKYDSLAHRPFAQLYPHDYFLKQFGSSPFGFLTEGEFDALILLQAGLPAVSLPSGVTSELHRWIGFLSRFERLAVLFDLDDAGCKARDELFRPKGKLTRAEAECLRIAHVEEYVWNPDWGKDVTEARERLVPELLEFYAQLV